MVVEGATQVKKGPRNWKNGTKITKSMLIQEMRSLRPCDLPKWCMGIRYMTNEADNLLLVHIWGLSVPHRSKKVQKIGKNVTKITKSMLIQEMRSLRPCNLPKWCMSVRYMSNKADNLLLVRIWWLRVPHRSKMAQEIGKMGPRSQNRR